MDTFGSVARSYKGCCFWRFIEQCNQKVTLPAQIEVDFKLLPDAYLESNHHLSDQFSTTSYFKVSLVPTLIEWCCECNILLSV